MVYVMYMYVKKCGSARKINVLLLLLNNGEGEEYCFSFLKQCISHTFLTITTECKDFSALLQSVKISQHYYRV